MQQVLKRVREFLSVGIWRERPASTRARAAALRSAQVLVLAVREFLANRCLVHATALAYTTLLSLVPLLALAFALAKGFGVERQIRPLVDTWLAANQEEVGEKLTGFIEQTIQYVQHTKVGVMGGIGLLLLVWATIRVMGTIEKSFNEIWRVSRSRTLARKFTDYISVLVVSPVLLVAATSAGAAIRSTAVVRSALSWWLVARLVEWSLVLIPTWVAFAAAYVFLPNTRVRFRCALAGGIVAGTAWQVAFWAYTTFQVGMAKYNAIYGTFAALPVLMVWLYLSWAVILFGAQVSWAAQNAGRHWDERRASAASFAAKETVALRSMAALAVAFHRDGAALSPEQIARQIGAPQVLVTETVRALAAAGICSETVRPDGTAFQPARPLERITPDDVLGALRDRGEPIGEEGTDGGAAVVSELLATWAAARRQCMASPTFREIALRLAEPPGKSARVPGPTAL
ncbi:MAG TPA: YhjD/YihY/BrkB family envelope integrity protein [Planctomycetota bacterium]|nr:YhjD/YihY/BrkB family envelope integrity protein [Planctomycetota bacterium]HRR81879.1 YhjD/YihY/BrkB family envelope integrity protein [Planctomycetota bacterium]HRT97659.1 YhjD/YihY/BrkB family envelope integrity protein [Planctomycetota bacterium]